MDNDESVTTDLEQILQDRFGLQSFRGAQRDAIADICAGKDVLCVMPTGAGKSLCFQLSSVVRGGLCVVVSPLIALMEDQVRLMRLRDIPAAYLNSSLDASTQRYLLDEIRDGFEGLLYVAPERMVMPEFRQVLADRSISLLAIDEAHCISQWGHDFRPEYGQIGEIRQSLNNPPTIALTATATDDVRADIIRLLALQNPRIYITGFDRPNLDYRSKRLQSNKDRDEELEHLVSNEPGSQIIYCAKRSSVDSLTEQLRVTLPTRTIVGYHAGMPMPQRAKSQNTFMNVEGAIVIATNAFGMGINKPDVRQVIHYHMPGTIEAYYQEAGRAGRDGLPARCVLLYRPADRETQEFFIEQIGKDNPDADPRRIDELRLHARQKLDLMTQYAAAHRCRRQMILDYFGDETEVENCTCDVCGRGGAYEEADLSESTITLIRKLLSGVARLNRRFGAGAVAELLAGSNTDRVRKFGWDRMPSYGLLRDHDIRQIRTWLDQLMEAGLARQVDPDGRFRPLIELTPAGVDVMKGTKRPPAVLAGIGAEDEDASDAYDPYARAKRDRRDRRERRPRQSDEPLDAPSQVVFDRLRAARSALARQQSVPAYVICHDATLREIARQRPTDEDALAAVRGMGPMKIKLYGPQLLAAVTGEAADVRVTIEESQVPFGEA